MSQFEGVLYTVLGLIGLVAAILSGGSALFSWREKRRLAAKAPDAPARLVVAKETITEREGMLAHVAAAERARNRQEERARLADERRRALRAFVAAVQDRWKREKHSHPAFLIECQLDDDSYSVSRRDHDFTVTWTDADGPRGTSLDGLVEMATPLPSGWVDFRKETPFVAPVDYILAPLYTPLTERRFATHDEAEAWLRRWHDRRGDLAFYDGALQPAA